MKDPKVKAPRVPPKPLSIPPVRKDPWLMWDFPPALRLRFRQHCERNHIPVTQGLVGILQDYLLKNEQGSYPFSSH